VLISITEAFIRISSMSDFDVNRKQDPIKSEIAKAVINLAK
jgi:hypothetical protein